MRLSRSSPRNGTWLPDRSDGRILQVRGMLYELLTHCIPASTIIKVFHFRFILMQNLAFALLPKLDEELKPEVIHWATFYEHRIRTGSKVIFHLEAFVAKGSPNTDLTNGSYEDNCRVLDGTVLGVECINNFHRKVSTVENRIKECKILPGQCAPLKNHILILVATIFVTMHDDVKEFLCTHKLSLLSWQGM